MEIKEQVKNAVSIVDIASLYVDLKPSGKNFKALCPFHHEKTASFYVMPEKGTFTCYGCHAYGDIFTMVQQQEGLNFPEAMKFIIERFHLPLTPQHKKSEGGEQFERVNELAQSFFTQQLWDSEDGKKAREYLSRRGISEETMRTFGIGFAPNLWDGLRRTLDREGFSSKMGVDMGLLVDSEQGRTYDRFRNRVIVPIMSMNGKIMGFGGRALDDQPAKYINSPETPLYKKGQHLYAFNLARQHIRSEGAVILVEGYFDQISLYQHGIQNVAASLGTALTDEQAYLIKRFSDLVYICYDNDAAGQKAAAAAVEKLLAHQVSTRVVRLSCAKDPDEEVRKVGARVFREQLQKGVEGFRFLLSRLGEASDLKDPLAKSRAIQNLAPIMQKVEDRLVRLDLMKKCEDYFNIPFEEINRHMSMPKQPPARPREKRLLPTLAEADFLKVLLTFPERIDQLQSLLDDELLKSLSIGRIIKAMLEPPPKNAHPPLDHAGFTSALITRLSEPDRELLQGITEQITPQYRESVQVDNTLETCMLLFVDRQNRKKIERLNRQIHMAEQNGDTAAVHELMRMKNQYIKTRRLGRQTMPRPLEGADRRP